MTEFEKEYQLFQGGAYNETLQQWLLASWQGDALQVMAWLTCKLVSASSGT